MSDTRTTPAYATDPERGRCNRPKSEVRRRSQLVGVRMTEDERARFQALADRRGVALPELMRLAVEGALINEAIQQAHAMGWQ